MAWYGARCVFEFANSVNEERITLWSAESFDMAIELAEAEAAEYAAETDVLGYVGLARAYLIGDDTPQSGSEVFSLLRNCELAPQAYVSAFFDTGGERQQHHEA